MSSCESRNLTLPTSVAELYSDSIDVRHMPQGCATWPAFWETNDNNWPAGGEVDIVSVVIYKEG